MKPPKRRNNEAHFHVLSMVHHGVITQKVPIVRRFLSRDADLALHYGEDFPAWESQFILALKSHVSGVTILRAHRARFSAAGDERVYMQIDGEYAGRLPGQVEIVADALTMLIPEGYGERRE